jgi:hypothetical protein
MPPIRDQDAHWRIDKKVPIALLVGLVAQAAAGVWFAAALQGQVTSHDRRLGTLEATDTRINEDARRISEALARLDERLQAQTAILRRVEDALGRPQGNR